MLDDLFQQPWRQFHLQQALGQVNLEHHGFDHGDENLFACRCACDEHVISAGFENSLDGAQGFALLVHNLQTDQLVVVIFALRKRWNFLCADVNNQVAQLTYCFGRGVASQVNDEQILVLADMLQLHRRVRITQEKGFSNLQAFREVSQHFHEDITTHTVRAVQFANS